MTSILWRIAQLKGETDILLVTQSAENLGSCLNSLLKTGAVIASGDLGSGPQEQVFASKRLNYSCLENTIRSVRLPLRRIKSGL